MTLTACAGGDRDIATPADNQDKHDETEVIAPEDKKVEENENDESEGGILGRRGGNATSGGSKGT